MRDSTETWRKRICKRLVLRALKSRKYNLQKAKYWNNVFKWCSVEYKKRVLSKLYYLDYSKMIFTNKSVFKSE